jgi:hypothetical protein
MPMSGAPMDPHTHTHSHAPVDFDVMMRHLTIVGFVSLAVWVVTGVGGLVAGLLTIQPQATLRFLLAVLIVVFARRTYWELREWRWNRVDPDDRFGFSNPMWEHPRTSELTDTPATGPQPTEG